MAKEINVQETIQSDFSVVVNYIAEELLPRLMMDEVIRIFWRFRKSPY